MMASHCDDVSLAFDALVASLRADRKLLSAFLSARAQNISSICCGHALAETMLVSALAY